MKRTSFIIIFTLLITVLLSGCGGKLSSQEEVNNEDQASSAEQDLKVPTPQVSDSTQGLWQTKLKEFSKDNKYVVLFIDDNSTKESNAIRDSFKENVEKTKESFRMVEVNYTKEKASLLKVIKAQGISKFPLAVTIAPNGAITGSFDKGCTNEELKATVISNRESEALLSVQNGKVVLFCVHKGQPGDFSKVKSVLKAVETNFNGVVVSQYLNKDDKNDMEFIKKLPETSSNTTVLIMVPGQGIKAQLEGEDINNTNLLQAIQSSCSSGSCGTGGCN